MTTQTTNPDSLPDTFDALSALHQLRPIRDDIDYEQAVLLMDRLAVMTHRSQDQEDYLETLTELITKYDDAHYSQDLSHITPVETLKHLMERQDMKENDLAELLQVDSIRIPCILDGRQELSATQIRILSAYFKVSPGLFI